MALSSLTDIQRRRVMLHYFDEMTIKEIAKVENAVIRVVSRSIRKAEENIAKYFLKNF